MPLNVDNKVNTFTRPKFEPEYDAATKQWVTSEVPGTVTLEDYIVRDQISYDGKYFNNLHTISSKLFADWDPAEFVTIHSDARMYFGLWGREPLESLSPKGNFLGMTDKTPMVKWNMGIHFHLPQATDVSVLGYNLLGNDHNEHAVRWQQMSAASQDGYFTVDQRTFGLKVSKGF